MTWHKFLITGIVQGVGFRPFILREARKSRLKGYVKNTGAGVEIVTNDKTQISKILEKIPPLAKIDQIKIEKIEDEKFDEFIIKNSDPPLPRTDAPPGRLHHNSNTSNFSIPPDIAPCKNCKKELFDPKNRRYQYFFTSCTNCGPRFSIAEKFPFDRANTTLEKFPMCEECKKEYSHPDDRRFHAQTIACEICGPTLSLYDFCKDATCCVSSRNNTAIQKSINLLKSGEILAIKSIGGFSLICLTDKKAVAKLRDLTHRPNKPFACMTKDANMIKNFVHISKKEKEILESRERPIVLLHRKDAQIGRNHISENNFLGFCLPYAPLHHLIFEHLDEPIIFTSSNLPGIPITTKKEQQFVPHVLDYDREIANFSDDSIIKMITDHPLLVRRSRGFVPAEIPTPKNYQTFEDDILAVGGEMKNTFCLKKGNALLLSQHLGNTSGLENFENFRTTLDKFLKFTGAKPKIILCDKNPSFNTTKFAQDFAAKNKIECVEVQHHVAHVFSTAIEHNYTNFLGIAVDGTGWGEDNKIWGGEVFHNDIRIGKLEDQTLIGGDIANKEPVRMLIGILSYFLDEKEIINLLSNFNEKLIKNCLKQKKENFNCIESSSGGRILDCVAILLGLADKNNYEGRCAQMLEIKNNKNVPSLKIENCKLKIEKKDSLNILLTTILFQFLTENLDKISKEELAHLAQLYLAGGLFKIAKKHNSNLPIVASGGCVYNSIMTSFWQEKNILLNQNVPSGDGGISVGQIAYFLWKNRK